MAVCASLMGCCMKKNNSILKRKTKIMTTKTKMIFIMSFLTLVIVGCVASMVIVLAAPKQNGILDVSIKYDAFAIRKEAEQFNGRDYYYIRMGEYPQTYAGAATSVTGLTETQEKFVCDMSTAVNEKYTVFTEGKEYNIFVDSLGNKYIKHTINVYKNQYEETDWVFENGTSPVNGEEAFFRIEPIIWDIVGYYTDDSKSAFVRASDSNFDANHRKNLIVSSRYSLQTALWNVTEADIDYNNSYLYKWLRRFENNVLANFFDKIEEFENTYNDTSETTEKKHIGNGGTVKERAWIIDINQSEMMYPSKKERVCSPSDFALATYAYQWISNEAVTIAKPQGGGCYYWTRTSCFFDSTYWAVDVYNNGRLDDVDNIHETRGVVRPYMLINL